MASGPRISIFLGFSWRLEETYKALVLQGVPPTFKMRPVTGPLQTGTYIQELLDAPGKYTMVNSDRWPVRLRADKWSKWCNEGLRVQRFVKYNLSCVSGSSRVWATTHIEPRRKFWMWHQLTIPGKTPSALAKGQLNGSSRRRISQEYTGVPFHYWPSHSMKLD